MRQARRVVADERVGDGLRLGCKEEREAEGSPHRGALLCFCQPLERRRDLMVIRGDGERSDGQPTLPQWQTRE